MNQRHPQSRHTPHDSTVENRHRERYPRAKGLRVGLGSGWLPVATADHVCPLPPPLGHPGPSARVPSTASSPRIPPRASILTSTSYFAADAGDSFSAAGTRRLQKGSFCRARAASRCRAAISHALRIEKAAPSAKPTSMSVPSASMSVRLFQHGCQSD